MTLEEEIKRFTDNAEYERTHGNLQGCLEFKQLAEWLKDYKRLLEQEPCIQPKPKTDVLDKIKSEIKEVQTYKMFEGEDTVYVERKDILAIINKYKAESEE